MQEFGVANIPNKVHVLKKIPFAPYVVFVAGLPHSSLATKFIWSLAQRKDDLLHPRLDIRGARDHLRHVRHIGIGNAKEHQGWIEELGDLSKERSKVNIVHQRACRSRLLLRGAVLRT